MKNTVTTATWDPGYRGYFAHLDEASIWSRDGNEWFNTDTGRKPVGDWFDTISLRLVGGPRHGDVIESKGGRR